MDPSSAASSHSKSAPEETKSRQDKGDKKQARGEKKQQEDGGGGGKQDKGSSKADKKAKRAAAVAARATTSGPGSSNQPNGQASHGGGGHKGSVKDDKMDGLNGSSNTAANVSVAQGTGGPGGSAGTTVATASTSIAAVSTLLFSHLPSCKPPPSSSANSAQIHPLVVRLGLLLSTPSDSTTPSPGFQPPSPPLRGTNARTTALLLTFRQVILDHSWPPREMHRVLPAYLSPMIGYLDSCRPKGVAGGNVIRWLKAEINRVGTDESVTDESEQKALIVDAIDGYLKERIELAGEVICSLATEKIKQGETVVTFARSSLVEQVLLEAWRRMREDDPEASFHVVVVDSSPLYEGELSSLCFAVDSISHSDTRVSLPRQITLTNPGTALDSMHLHPPFLPLLNPRSNLPRPPRNRRSLIRRITLFKSRHGRSRHDGQGMQSSRRRRM